jgi:hypothetical protein
MEEDDEDGNPNAVLRSVPKIAPRRKNLILNLAGGNEGA